MLVFILICCLLPAVLKADAQCALQTGTCKYTREGCSGGQFWKGKCSGNRYRQCCIPGSLSGDNKCVDDEEGFCQIQTNSCSGSYKSRKCAGAWNRKCCIPSSTGGTGASGTTSTEKVGQLCESNPTNELRTCDGYGCGHYGAPRGPRKHKGVDVKCKKDDDVYAPFPGKVVRNSIPYSWKNKNYRKCCNTGLKFQGTGSWSDYKFNLWYVKKSGRSGTSYNKGDVIGTHKGLGCCYGSGMTDHTHFQLYKKGNIIDPTKMVTG